jgi:signal transduction histidine kinase
MKQPTGKSSHGGEGRLAALRHRINPGDKPSFLHASSVPVAMALGLGTGVVLFLVYEAVERLFLSAAPAELLHKLHILRGLSSSVLAAGITALSLHGLAPAFAPGAALSGASEQDDRATWLVDLRWLALLGVVIAVFLGGYVFETVAPTAVPFLWGGVGMLLVTNILYLGLARGRTNTQAQVTFQISTDLVILTYLLAFSGGLANPAACVMAFHALLAGIVIERRRSVWVVLGASVLLCFMALLEQLEALPPSGFRLAGFGLPLHEPWSRLAGLIVLLWGTWFFATALADRLRRSHHEALAAVFDRLSDGFAAADSKGRLVYVNAVAERILGKPEEALRGRPVCEALCGPSGAIPLHGAGEPCPLVSTAGPHLATVERRGLRLHAYGERRRLILMEDIAAELEFERRKEDWRNMIAHDMRTPLTMMMGSLAMMEEDASLGSGDRNLLAIALRGCRRMLDLLNLELDVAKLTAGLMPMRVQSVAVRDLARECAEEAASVAAANGVRMVVEVDKGVVARGDAGMLHRVLLNLIDNALNFTSKGGEVRLSASKRSDRSVLIVVKDSGPGIAPEDVPKVFDRYYQARARQAGHRHGTGLGLTFCIEALKAMGGTITLTSTLGEGCEFSVMLPESAG